MNNREEPSDPKKVKKRADERSGASPDRESPGGLEGARILITDDDEVNRRVAIGLLNKLGCSVTSACNGVEAIDKLSNQRFDLVLMDVLMPYIDGVTATKMIRDPGSKVLDHDIPIIAFTSCVDEGTRRVCFEAGVNGFLTKPVSKANLRIEIEKNLSRKKETPESEQRNDPVPE